MIKKVFLLPSGTYTQNHAHMVSSSQQQTPKEIITASVHKLFEDFDIFYSVRAWKFTFSLKSFKENYTYYTDNQTIIRAFSFWCVTVTVRNSNSGLFRRWRSSMSGDLPYQVLDYVCRSIAVGKVTAVVTRGQVPDLATHRRAFTPNDETHDSF